MPKVPKSDKKCVKCGAPAQVHFTDLKCREVVDEKALCRSCAQKEGFSGLMNIPCSKLHLLVTVLEHAIRSRDNIPLIHTHLKELTGKKLPADPSVWRKWAKEHPEKVRVDKDKFTQALSELGFETDSRRIISPGKMLLRRIPENNVEFLLDQLEEAIESTSRILSIHAQMKEITGKDLPADPEAWQQWMREHPKEIAIDMEKFRKAIRDLEIRIVNPPPDWMKEKPD